MKKILCLIDTLGMGGAERQMIGLTLFLKQKGYVVDLVTYNIHNFYSELVEKYGLGTKTLYVRNNRLSKILSVLKHIKKAGGYDYVIAYKDGPAIISCLLKIFGSNFKLIVSERNTTQNINFNAKLKFFLYRWADYVVPNSYSQEEFIKSHFPALSNNIVTISNFTDTNHFIPIDTQENNKVIVLTVARIARQKNIPNYLKAIKKLKEEGYSGNVHFDWYGDIQTGEEQNGELCYHLREELGIQDMIDFHPATTQIVQFYQTCDIFCLPSIYEGFPNVICEAMSCGKPILCSRVCDNPYIVQDGINGIFFNPQDVDSIYNGLKQMITKPRSELKEWGNNSRKIGLDLFSKETFVQKYIDLLK